MNAESVILWREYVKMEMGFVESIRRRWQVLGIKEDETKSKGKQKALDVDVDMDMVTKLDEDGGDEDVGVEARRAIMQGAIVKSVITSAVRGVSLRLQAQIAYLLTDITITQRYLRSNCSNH